MLNIAIGLSLLIGVFLSPGSRVLALFIDMNLAKHGLEPHQVLLMNAAVNFWITTAIVYSIINITNLKNRLVPTKKISATVFVANIVVILYIAARAFASTVEGGGGSFVVRSFSIFTFVPALIALGVAFIFLIKNSLVAKPEGTESGKTNIPLNVIVIISAIFPIGYVAQLLHGENSPFKEAQQFESVFNAYCKESGEEIFSTVSEKVNSLYIKAGDARFGIGENGKAKSSSYGEMKAKLLDRGKLDFVEFDNTSKRDYQSEYLLQVSGDREGKPIDTLSSKYAVIAEKLASEADRKMGLRGEKISIINLQTNEVIAHTTYFFNKNLWLFCGHAPNNRFSTFEFIKRVIPLG